MREKDSSSAGNADEAAKKTLLRVHVSRSGKSIELVIAKFGF